ncbi:uncharacterized protein LOC126821081 [Patella vulgata]|uniref:uncharacterized protein LOC126821081 n=1 Tax=Patella vulgata TaxID=6465 RepID=UPI00217F6052|nr:uncharacterized protein LOC126821081 [Patella vulgata]
MTETDLPNPRDYVKCVVVGDGEVGKTCLLVSYTTDKFPTVHVPTVFENYAVTLTVGDQSLVLGLFDTAGQEEFDRLRVLAYPDTDVFVVCFSVMNPTSFENVKEKWIPEVRHHTPGVPIVLVGTKSDLRHSYPEIKQLEAEKRSPVKFQQGLELASEIGAHSYVECSALTQDGLKDVFETAVYAAIGGGGNQSSETDKCKTNNHKRPFCVLI